jgi:hypothetical protein
MAPRRCEKPCGKVYRRFLNKCPPTSLVAAIFGRANPEQPIDREQPGSTQALAAENVQLMTEREVLQFPWPPGWAVGGQPLRRSNARVLASRGTLRAANRKTLKFFEAFGVFGMDSRFEDAHLGFVKVGDGDNNHGVLLVDLYGCRCELCFNQPANSTRPTAPPLSFLGRTSSAPDRFCE